MGYVLTSLSVSLTRSGSPSARLARVVDFLKKRVNPVLPNDVIFTVTDATEPPKSGDVHDYQSLGFYWFPCNEALTVCNKEVK